MNVQWQQLGDWAVSKAGKLSDSLVVVLRRQNPFLEYKLFSRFSRPCQITSPIAVSQSASKGPHSRRRVVRHH